MGVIGGSGLYDLDGLHDVEQRAVDTPFGAPSGAIAIDTLAGRRVTFLARHGAGHRLLPGEVPSRANIWALRSLGVEHVLAVSAVDLLREEVAPLHAVVPDQLIDRTWGQPSTFFGGDAVAHIGFADPFCADTAGVLAAAAEASGVRTHPGGTLVVIEGPAFSTQAESEFHRAPGATIVGMTALPEAKLAREAELCYASLSFVTDYDVWHTQAANVSVELVLANLERNADHAHTTIASAVAQLPAKRTCECGQSLAGALVTAPAAVPAAARERVALLINRYWGSAP
ncbi:MAG: S-methyl-5'-thioadenosine phosphorylase [Chloroflexi bacterium]|nr:S-methyl-5'-thioadenosine phosphorylase [Chloroflexota bacterium]